MSTTTTSQLVKERIDHLWSLVLNSTASASYSRYLSKMIFRLAQDNEIKIQPTFFQMVCSCCFTFFVPGENCIQRFHTIKKIRRFKGNKNKAKSGIKNILFSSQLLGSNEKNSNKKGKDKLFSTFKCKKCKTLIVYDNAPLEFLENKPEIQAKLAKPNNPPKKESLQKVLQKSQIPKQIDSGKKEMDLESFLQGFL